MGGWCQTVWMLCQAFPFWNRKGEALSGAALRTIAVAFLSSSESSRCYGCFGLTWGELNALAPPMTFMEEGALSPILPDSTYYIVPLLLFGVFCLLVALFLPFHTENISTSSFINQQP